MSRICLVVDDSSVVRKVVSRIVKTLGFTPVEAENGQEALDKSKEQTPEVVLLDWNMPVMNGMDFLQEFRKHKENQNVKVIFCTTENDVTKIMCAMEAGANEYIMKPFDEEIIKTKFSQIGLL
jgi:two-component system chemotaxis response regulator CheY